MATRTTTITTTAMTVMLIQEWIQKVNVTPNFSRNKWRRFVYLSSREIDTGAPRISNNNHILMYVNVGVHAYVFLLI